jgi:hypothetical protein
MKKTITIIAIILIAAKSNAQTTDTVKIAKWYQSTAIKLNPLSATSGFINLQAEKMIGAKSSLNLIYLLGFKTADGGGQGFSLGLEYRYYYTGKPIKGGAYLAPFVRYRDISFFQVQEITDGNGTTKTHQPIPYTNYGGGVVMGKQWSYLKNKLLFDLYGGID